MTGGWIEPELLREFDAEQTSAHRLCSASDGWVERFANDALLSYKNNAARERLATELFIWSETIGFPLGRLFGRFLPRKNEERSSPRLLLGDKRAEPRTVALERKLQFGIDFSSGYSSGLFVDQRENRRFIRELRPRNMLNCFAYTCAFSVAAASAGAATLNIDLSRKSLERGRENFALNSLSHSGHRFLADDVFAVLPRLVRKGEKFDLIVLDPPTFSRSPRGKAFQVEKDFEELLLRAMEVADRDCRLLLSTNCHKLDERGLEVVARYCLRVSRRAGRVHHEPAPVEFPRGVGARTLWLTLR